MALITKAYQLIDDVDHRAVAVNMQGKALDDAWAAVLGSTLETNGTVRSVNLNRCKFNRRAWIGESGDHCS